MQPGTKESEPDDPVQLRSWIPAYATEQLEKMGDEINLDEIFQAGAAMARQLIDGDGGFVVLAPGDGTRYEISMVIVRDGIYRSRNEYHTEGIWMASSLGPGYILPHGRAPHDWGYVAEHWSANDNPWTGMVFWLFQLAVFEVLT